MAKLYISEYSNAVTPAGSNISVVSEPMNTDQTPVTIGATSTQSAAFGGNTTVVRLHTDAICSVAFGSNPTATASNKRLAANTTEYFAVPLGSGLKVAVITNT